MWKKTGNIIAIGLLLTLCGSIRAADIRVTATVDSTTVYVFDRITYEVSVEGSIRSVPAPKVRIPSGLKSLGGPQTSSQIQFVNGNWSSKMTYTYTFRAEKPGNWTIPPAEVSFKGKKYTSQPIVIHVQKLDAAKAFDENAGAFRIPRSRMDDVFLWATVDTPNPYVGQGITVSYHIFTRVKIVNYDVQEEPAYSGFWSEDVPIPKNPKIRSRVVNGVRYSEAVIKKVALYPTVTGELVIDPLSMVLEVQSSRSDPFDAFFQSPFGRSPFNFNQKIVRESQGLTIHVKPLPVKGKPADFSGAVGEFELSATLDKSSVKVGEGVTLKVTLAGDHTLQTLPAPKLPPLKNFKTFEPRAGEIGVYDKNPLWKARTFDYILVPHKPGDFTIPSVTYSYFNPDDKKYHLLKSKPLNVHVEQTDVTSQAIFVQSEGGKIELLGTDIRYIKTDLPILDYEMPYLSAWFFTVLLLPVPLVPIILIYGKHRRKMMGDTAYARWFKAKSRSQQRFKHARDALNDARFDDVLDECAKAFTGYIVDRLNLPEGRATQGEIEKELARRRLPEDLLNAVREYLQQIETARFAPVKPGKEEASRMVETGMKLVDRLEREKLKLKKNKKKTGRRSE